MNVLEQYRKEHSDPRKSHWIGFRGKSGKDYIVNSSGEVIGPNGIEKFCIFVIAKRGYWKYEGPWDGFPIAFVVNALNKSNLGEITERHYECYCDPNASY